MMGVLRLPLDIVHSRYCPAPSVRVAPEIKALNDLSV